MPAGHTLGKRERIKGRKAPAQLFDGSNSHSLTAFPLRVVFAANDRQGDQPLARIMVSVPKRLLKKAVDRNRVKRQVREAYRLAKDRLDVPQGKTIDMAFVWMDARLYDSATVAAHVRNLLKRIGGKI